MKKVLSTLCLICLCLFAKAQSADSTDAGKFSISGYIDSYYFKNFNNPLSGSNLGASGFERAFDQREGQFQLGLVQTKFAYSNTKSDMVIDLTFGPNADLGNYGNVLGPNSTITSTSLAIKQAYFTYKATDKLSFTAGQFGTHIGYEVIDAPVNYNYSLSNLFTNGPFYHLGVKASYAISDKVGLMAGLVNGWDAIIDNNGFKTGIAQLFVSPAEGWNVYLNWIGGNENAYIGYNNSDSLKVSKQMIDLTTSYQITDKFLIGVNAAYGTRKVEKVDAEPWGGMALYTNYAISDVFGLGLRAEYFDNTQGVQGIGSTDVTSITATGNITLASGHLLLKPEFRIDTYKKAPGAELQQFQDDKGAFNKNSQATLGMAFIYKF